MIVKFQVDQRVKRDMFKRLGALQVAFGRIVTKPVMGRMT